MTEVQKNPICKGAMVECEAHPYGDLRVVSIRNGQATLALWHFPSKYRYKTPLADLRPSENAKMFGQ